RKFRLPDMDYIPRTLEEKIVCNADTLLKGDRVARIEEICEDYKNKGLESEVPRLMSLYNYLERKCKFNIEDLLSLNVKQDFKS
ncbi:MAG: hypothetical protein QW062_05225, partial [Thermoplasmatales archaeon]